MSDSPEVSDGVKMMTAIGHICLQWARLEMGLLGIIYTIEGMPMEKGEIIFGGLDILPRVGMALNLGRYAKIPPPMIKRIAALRIALQAGVSDRRNQAIHGAHKDFEVSGFTTVTMVRWKGDKRSKYLSAADLYALGEEIFELGNECWSIINDIGTWKLGPHHNKNLDNTVT